jgi:hypothetical protein
MIPLHRKVHQPKAETLAPSSQSPPHAPEERMRAERRQPAPNPQRDMQRTVPRESSAPQMRNTGTPALRWPTRASTRPAP